MGPLREAPWARHEPLISLRRYLNARRSRK